MLLHGDKIEAENQDPSYDCQSCGACCINDPGAGPGYVSLHASDVQRIQRLGLPVVKTAGHLELGTVPYDGPGGDRICVAFEGTVGQRCSCTIYEEQPKRCRNFVIGGVLCRIARYLAGLGPQPREMRSSLRSLANLQEGTQQSLLGEQVVSR
jgi:Fe-S-cluster containining protein